MLNTFFSSLLLPDNNIRLNAENSYSKLYEIPENVIPFHVLAFSSENINVRILAASLLSRNFYRVRPSLYHYLNNQQQLEFQQLLLQLLSSNSPSNLLGLYSSLVYDVSTVAKPFFNLFETLEQLLSSSNPNHRSNSLSTLSLIVLFSEQTEEFIRKFLLLSIQLLGDVGSVVVAATNFYKVCTNVCEEYGQEFENEVVSYYSTFLNASQRIIENDPINGIKCLENICDMNEETALFRPNILQTARLALMALEINNTSIIPAMECLVVLLETYQTLENATLPTIKYIFQWLCTIVDSKEWYDHKQEDDCLYTAAEDFFMRIVLFKPTKEVISLLPTTPTWQEARSFIFMFTQILSIDKSVSGIIPKIYPTILSWSSLHPRVTFEIIVFANRVLIHFKEFHETFEQVVCSIIESGIKTTITRIQARSCDLLTHYIENSPRIVIENKLPQILHLLNHTLQSSNPYLLAESICSISFLAVKVKKSFTPFVNDLLNGYFNMLDNIPNTRDHFDLRGRIIESISILGFYANKNDLPTFTSKLLTHFNLCLSSQDIKVDDPLMGYIENAIIRLLPLLRTDMYQFITNFLPFMLQRCSLEIPISSASGLSEERTSALSCLSILLNEAFQLLIPHLETIASIIVDSSRIANTSISLVATNSAATLINSIVHNNPITQTDIKARMFGVLDSSTRSCDSNLVTSAMNGMERIIASDITIDSELLMTSLATITKRIEQFDDTSIVINQLLSTLSTAIVLGSMNDAYIKHLHPIVETKLRGTSTERVVALRILKIAIRDGGLKMNGLIHCLKDECIAVKVAGISAITASFFHGFEDTLTVVNIYWELIQTNDLIIKEKAIRQLGKIIVALQNQQQALQWIKYLPLQNTTHKTAISLCKMIKLGLITIGNDIIQLIIHVISENMIHCSHDTESLLLLREVIQICLNQFNQITISFINSLSLPKQDAIKSLMN
ncbi:Importin beta-3 subunit family protein [Entamoeba marina]